MPTEDDMDFYERQVQALETRSTLGSKSALALGAMMSAIMPAYGTVPIGARSYSKPPSSLPAKLRNKRIKAKKQARQQRKKGR